MPSLVGAIAACWLANASASAPEPDVTTTDGSAWTLEWSAPPSCPDREAVLARVDALVPGERPRGSSPAARGTMVARGKVVEHADRWSLELSVGGESRRMQAGECETLVDVTALVVAIELDSLATIAALPVTRPVTPSPVMPSPVAAVPPVPSVDTSEARPARPPAVAPLRAPRPPTWPSRSRAPGLALGLHTGVGVGGLPSPSPLLGGSVVLAWPRFRVMALAESWPRQVALYPNQAIGAALGLGAAGLRACPVLHSGRVEVPLCAGTWVGGLRGEGRGVERSRAVTDVWAAVELEPGVAFAPRPMVALRLGVAGLATVRRPAYLLGERPVLYRAPAAGARITLALELRLRGERFRP